MKSKQFKHASTISAVLVLSLLISTGFTNVAQATGTASIRPLSVGK